MIILCLHSNYTISHCSVRPTYQRHNLQLPFTLICFELLLFDNTRKDTCFHLAVKNSEAKLTIVNLDTVMRLAE